MKVNKNNFSLKRFVIFEKCDTKNYIINSEKYLNGLGIAIYVLSEKSTTTLRTTYSSPSLSSNLNKLFKLYSFKALADFYKTFTSNPKLKKMKCNPYNLESLGCKALITNENEHHKKYIGNLIQNELSNYEHFLICCNSNIILKMAGYTKTTTS